MTGTSQGAPSGAPDPVNGTPSLNALLLERMAELGLRNQTKATIQAPHRDPYRMEKYRPEAEWLAAAMEQIPNLPTHVRGLHYAALGTTKPNGETYENTEENSDWIGDKPAKAARWLGLVPWEHIKDEKNDPPTVTLWTPPEPEAVIRVGQVEVALPDELAPKVDLDDFKAAQPYKLVLFAEKAAVGHVVRPIAERFQIDLYLEAGEISDSHLAQMAKIAAEDGRPIVVFTLSDADPAGYHMPCVVAWKLGAQRDGWFPDLEFEVHPIGFLPEQVHAINANGTPLPSSPLKAGEKRAGAWETTFGIQQVELDAVATLRPDVLDEIVRDGIRPFFDSSLPRRAKQAREAWRAAAQKRLEAQLGAEMMAELRDGLENKLADLRDLADEINEQLWLPTDGLDLPPMPELPAPRVNGTPLPLASSAMGFGEFVRALKARGEYSKNGAGS